MDGKCQQCVLLCRAWCIGCAAKNRAEPARIRTWNLLIRSQTRYPLRHRSTATIPSLLRHCEFSGKHSHFANTVRDSSCRQDHKHLPGAQFDKAQLFRERCMVTATMVLQQALLTAFVRTTTCCCISRQNQSRASARPQTSSQG